MRWQRDQMQALAQQQQLALAQAQAQAQATAPQYLAQAQSQSQEQGQQQQQQQQQGGLVVWPWQQLFGASPDDGLIYPCVHAGGRGRGASVRAKTRR